MCCRFVLETSPELRPYIEAANRSPLIKLMTEKLSKKMIAEGEVRPADIVPVLAPDKAGKPVPFPMLWGFSVPGRRGSLFNARIETAMEKPTFRESWAKRRCVIPASYYFEWEHLPDLSSGKAKTGDKYRIHPKDSRLFFLAGLYRMEEQAGITVPVFTVLTRDSSPSVQFIHDRMPVILPENLAREWVIPSADPDRIRMSALTDMICSRC